EDISGFSLPTWNMEQNDELLTITTSSLRVIIHKPLWLEWHYKDNAGQWQELVNDRPTSAYLINAHGDGVAHYQSRRNDERFYGLGDKSG
ncbi:alpha-glucosidase, partial [Escherichia coli]|nr:alpha-glucosidase [Escherichia coli]